MFRGKETKKKKYEKFGRKQREVEGNMEREGLQKTHILFTDMSVKGGGCNPSPFLKVCVFFVVSYLLKDAENYYFFQ